MAKRTPEQVHADGGHEDGGVKSCSLCVPEIGPTPDSVSSEAAECNVCGREPYFRGLCGAHWATRRDMADEEVDRV